mmetsp:Transcript_66689/g.164357  ORF Transcript_66689/g.164357 Transcript_66689/m.164357 type:complete len:257 (+) Transcript_66689:1151-1921(+)
MEQQGAASLAERQVAQLVQDQQVQPQQAGRDAPGLALGLLSLQRIDEVHRAVEPHPPAVLRDPGHADGCGQVRLAGAGATHQHHVVCGLGELAARQLRHQLPVHGRDLEVEARQVTVDGEARCVHLVVHRARGPVHAFGLQQVLHQPLALLQLLGSGLRLQISPRPGHAVQPQRLEFNGHVTHGRPPAHRCAAGRSGPCPPAAVCAPSGWWLRSAAMPHRSASPARWPHAPGSLGPRGWPPPGPAPRPRVQPPGRR